MPHWVLWYMHLLIHRDSWTCTHLKSVWLIRTVIGWIFSLIFKLRKHFQGKRKLIYKNRGGREVDFTCVCVCMSVKLDVFHLKLKTKEVYLFCCCCYIVNRSFSHFKDLVSKRFWLHWSKECPKSSFVCGRITNL